MVEQIVPNVYRIVLPLTGNPLKSLNSYYIRGSEKEVVIDTGFRREDCAEALRSGLEEVGANFNNLDVIATHMHSDHLGNAESVLSPDHNIYLDAFEIEMMADVRRRGRSVLTNRFPAEGFPPEMMQVQRNDNPAFNAGLSKEREFPFVGMNDGDVLDLGGFRLQWVIVPGHTPGNSMLWNEENGIMFTGDHILYDITPNITWWHCAEDSLGSYLKSLERARSFPVKLGLPGHREVGDYYQRIDQLLAHHEYRLDEALKGIQEHPGINASDLAGHMSWKIRARNWEEFPPVQKYFAIGEAMAHIDHLLVRGLVRLETDADGNNHYFAV